MTVEQKTRAEEVAVINAALRLRAVEKLAGIGRIKRLAAIGLARDQLAEATDKLDEARVTAAAQTHEG